MCSDQVLETNATFALQRSDTPRLELAMVLAKKTPLASTTIASN